MSKCWVWSTLKSSCRYCTLFWPKYWADAGVLAAASAPIATAMATTKRELIRGFMVLLRCKTLAQSWENCPHEEARSGNGRVRRNDHGVAGSTEHAGGRCERGAQDGGAGHRGAARALQAGEDAVQQRGA